MISMPSVLAETEEVRVAGHDHLGLGSDGAFQHAVIVRISFDDAQGHSGNNGRGRGSNQGTGFSQALFGPAELVAQRTQNFGTEWDRKWPGRRVV